MLCFLRPGCSRASRRVLCAGCLLALARYSGDLPSCFGREVSGGVWPLLCAGPRRVATFVLGSDSVAGRPLLRGAATLNGSSVPLGHETVSETGPLLRWAHDLRMSGHYFALGRDRVTFALGPDPLALPLLCAGPKLCHSYASARVCDPGTFLKSRPLSTLGARSPCACASPRPRSPSLALFA